MTFDCEPGTTSFGVPPFLFDITNGVDGHGQPVDPFTVGDCDVGAWWFRRSAVDEFGFITLATKRAWQS